MSARMAAGALLLMLLAGCQRDAEAPAARAVPDDAASNPVVSQTVQDVPMRDVADVESLLVGSVAVADARQALLDAGWEPVADADCKRNVLGDDWQAVCAAEPQRCLPCEQPIGLVSAAADGHVLFRFRHPGSGARIELTGIGLLEDWDVRGETSRLEYLGWRALESAAP